MKSNSTIVLAVVSVLLAVVLFLIKHADNQQMAADAGVIMDFSNRLDSATILLSVRAGTIDGLSNRLEQCHSAAAALSNQLTQAQATLASDAEQLAKLNQSATAAAAENQNLNQQVMTLTNQMTRLTQQLALTQTSLTQTNQDLVRLQKDYARLDNRFRRDVAERVVVERKFNSPAEVKAQLKKLQTHSALPVTPESIYAGLNVEIVSNGVAHVIMPE